MGSARKARTLLRPDLQSSVKGNRFRRAVKRQQLARVDVGLQERGIPVDLRMISAPSFQAVNTRDTHCANADEIDAFFQEECQEERDGIVVTGIAV